MNLYLVKISKEKIITYNKEREKMKKVLQKCCGITLVLFGITIIAYPFYSKYNSKQERNQLLNEVYYRIEENKKNSISKVVNTPIPSIDVFEKKAIIEVEENEALEDAYSNLELEENETIMKDDLEEEKNKTIKEVLSYQTLLGVIEIEKLNIEFPIVEGSERSNIAVSIGHMKNSASLGAKGNCVLAGHRGGIYGVFFRDVDQLQKGDKVKVTNMNGEIFYYKMYDSFLVEPDEMWVIDDIGQEYTLTLVTCEEQSKKRRIIRCRLQ